MRRSKFKWKNLRLPTPEEERLESKCKECELRGVFKTLFVALFIFFICVTAGMIR